MKELIQPPRIIPQLPRSCSDLGDEGERTVRLVRM